MARRKKKAEEEGNNERWLITYSDLITLLMIFFILMYTMSRVDAHKYEAVANSLSIVLTGQSMSILETQGPSAIEGINVQQEKSETGSVPDPQGKLEEIKNQIAEFIESQQLEESYLETGQTSTALGDYIVIIEQERGLVISFKDALLFASGSDQLTTQARSIIKQVGSSLLDIPNLIRVEGHTDNRPIHTSKFGSNWELSVLRASNVVHVLNEEAGIAPQRLSVIGYGEYRPLVANEDATSQAMNRRVDIVILKQKYSYFEP